MSDEIPPTSQRAWETSPHDGAREATGTSEDGMAMPGDWPVVPLVVTDGDRSYLDGDSHLDGNMLAGPLRELFAVDLTGAAVRCDSCASTSPLARLRVYAHAPGLVARCPTCLAVLLRLVRQPAHAWLDLRGATVLRIAMPAEVPRL